MPSYKFSMIAAFLTVAFFVTANAKAELVRVTGVGALTYKNELTPQVKKQALENAKLSAFRKYMSGQPSARKSVFAKMEAKFRATLDTIIPEFSKQREKDDQEAKEYKVLISAAIDTTEVERIFDEASGENRLEGEFMTMFIARVATGETRKRFDDKRVKISESDAMEKARETAVSSGSGSAEGIEKNSFSRTATGGSRETKTRRAKVTYEPNIDLSNDIGAAIEEWLINADYEVVPYEELDDVPTLEELVDEGAFNKTGKLPRKVQKQYRRAARDEEVRFFGVGVIDIGLPKDDPVSGDLELTAFVNFEVYDLLCCKRAKKVGNVRKKMISVVGTDQSEMEIRAGNEAAILAIETVLGQLQKKAMKGQ